MSGSGRTIYIAGAGIAGLTLALALAKFGASVVVLERNDTVQEFGAGLQISPNAHHVLNQLGLDRQIATHSFEPQGIDLYPFRARSPLTTLQLGAAVREKYGAPYAVMHRGDLADILFKACRRFASIDILFGVRNFTAESHARGVKITIEEADGRRRNARAFALVGADGVNSLTRTSLLGGPAADYANRVAWRALVDPQALDGVIALDKTSLLFGPGYHAVCYPLPHREAINVALFARETRERALGAASPPKAPTLSPAPDDRFRRIMAAVGDGWGYWPLATVTADDWHRGGIGLIGDAAHAMVPFQAQGAAMAIEDAAVLAPLLMTEPKADTAFERHVTLRRARVDRVARVSEANGRAFHLEWPMSQARDVVLRLGGPLGHLRRLDWLYGYHAAPEPDLPLPARAHSAS